MRKVLPVLIVSLLSIPVSTPQTAKAQGLVEYALILVMSMSVDEAFELHTVGRPGPESTESMFSGVFTVTNLEDQKCTQTETLDVPTVGVVSTVKVQIVGNLLRLNDGEAEAVLDSCFTGRRNSIAVGMPISSMPDNLPASAAAGWSLINPVTGETKGSYRMNRPKTVYYFNPRPIP